MTVRKCGGCPPFTHWKNHVQFIFLSNFIQNFCMRCSAGALMQFPEEHCSLQKHLFYPSHPGWWPPGTLALLCEPGVECELNLLHTQWHILGEWLSRAVSFTQWLEGLLMEGLLDVKFQVVASSADSLPSSDSGVVSGFLPQISVVVNVPIHISFKVSFLAAEAFYLLPVLSLRM